MTRACTRLLGNLDCEYQWAVRAASGTGRRPRALPALVMKRISLYATLLRVLGEEGDELWTPAPVDPACLRTVPGLPEVRLLSGHDTRIPSNRRILGWADAPPWPLPRERIETAMRVNDRAFVLRNGWGLPEARLVDSLEAFDRARLPDTAWVAKARHSTAGRDRVVAAADDGSDSTRAALARLLRMHGTVVVEPWRQRTLDYGLWCNAEAGAPEALTYHEQEVGARGRFLGIRILPAHEQTERLTETMRQQAHAVRGALRAKGYEGPFGIDGWEYLLDDGQARTNYIGEINARLTFGRIAAALVKRVAYPLWGLDTGTVSLRFGTAPDTGPSDHCIPLLGSADGSEAFAWLERQPPGYEPRFAPA